MTFGAFLYMGHIYCSVLYNPKPIDNLSRLCYNTFKKDSAFMPYLIINEVCNGKSGSCKIFA